MGRRAWTMKKLRETPLKVKRRRSAIPQAYELTDTLATEHMTNVGDYTAFSYLSSISVSDRNWKNLRQVRGVFHKSIPARQYLSGFLWYRSWSLQKKFSPFVVKSFQWSFKNQKSPNLNKSSFTCDNQASLYPKVTGRIGDRIPTMNGSGYKLTSSSEPFKNRTSIPSQNQWCSEYPKCSLRANRIHAKSRQ